MGQNLTKEQIFNAVNTIVANGCIPTLSKLQDFLGSGSKVTIHKYFKQWKQEVFKKISDLNKSFDLENKSLTEEHRSLKLELQEKLKQNQYYAAELINAEKLNIDLKAKNQQLELEQEKLQLNLTAAKDWRLDIETIIQQIKTEIKLSSNQTIQNMQQTIDDLRNELKIVNHKSLEAIRDSSSEGHALLIQEKVHSINLQATVNELNKKLLENKKELNELNITNKIQIKTLLRENECLQQILQEYVGGENLSQLKKLRIIKSPEVATHAK